jgi:phage FluMu gp28-like protein
LKSRGNHRRVKKQSRTWRGSDVSLQRHLLDAEAKAFRESRGSELGLAASDSVSFLTGVCGLKAFWYVLELAKLYGENRFLAVRWPRQTGKSTAIGGLLLFDALRFEGLGVAFLAPSWRQAKLNVRRVGEFCRFLGLKGVIVKKTKIVFPNGSFIEAFPNNPDTIRGQTFGRVWIDEANFVSNADEMYDAVLFSTSTIEDSKLVASSTPFSRDSLFWRMCNDKGFAKFARHHFTYDRAFAPEGTLSRKNVDDIHEQFGDDPTRWRREMEAEWAEEDDVWLSQSLIVSCVGTVANIGQDLYGFSSEKGYSGEFFAGLDLAQTRDYCVLAVVERLNDRLFLRLLKIFPQPTAYASVLGFLKMLQDRWGGFAKIRVDFTREGPSLIKDMENAGINNAEGVNFSIPRKSEMAALLRERMASKKLFFPLLKWETPYRSDIFNELKVERFDLRADGAIGFSHPGGTHDDVFWSIALACFGTVEMQAFDIESLRFG